MKFPGRCTSLRVTDLIRHAALLGKIAMPANQGKREGDPVIGRKRGIERERRGLGRNEQDRERRVQGSI